MISKKATANVKVSGQAFLMEEHSDFRKDEYAFNYRIKISNLGKRPVQLLSRSWVITDSFGEINRVQGDGVVGLQPEIAPGRFFEYQSWTRIKSPMGTMHGHYKMRYLDDNALFDVEIPTFSLNVPSRIN